MESSIEIVQDKKVKKWIRYPIAFFLALFIIAVLITIMYVGIMFLIASVGIVTLVNIFMNK